MSKVIYIEVSSLDSLFLDYTFIYGLHSALGIKVAVYFSLTAVDFSVFHPSLLSPLERPGNFIITVHLLCQQL